jgi:predicted phage terminase large subunit-like protein
VLGSYAYAAQFQQRPSPLGGGIFKRHWWHYWRPAHLELPPVQVRTPDGAVTNVSAVPLPEGFDSVIQSWDLSFKDLSTSDFVVGQVWAALKADRFLLDQRRDRLDMPATLQAIRDMTAKWPNAYTKLVEDKANGSAVLSTLRHEVSGLVAVNPEGGKIARAQAVSPPCESGNVFLPHPAYAPWVDGLIQECASFPAGSHDDQVDALTQALNRLRSSELPYGLTSYLESLLRPKLDEEKKPAECPECGDTRIAVRGSACRCQMCAHQWSTIPKPAPHDPRLDPRLGSRASFLNAYRFS